MLAIQWPVRVPDGDAVKCVYRRRIKGEQRSDKANYKVTTSDRDGTAQSGSTTDPYISS